MYFVRCAPETMRGAEPGDQRLSPAKYDSSFELGTRPLCRVRDTEHPR